MSEKSQNNSLLPPSTSDNSMLLPLTASRMVISSASATGSLRNKCALKPGHSLMDWIRLGNSGVDLSGTQGCSTSVTIEELAKHKSRNDAWIAIHGIVYNVTYYMDFHPGGVEELMRGVGTDATKLFNEVHAWVNFLQLLNKCRIGPLKNMKIDTHAREPFKTNNKPESFLKVPRLMLEQDTKPRLDWIQKRNDLTICFYTKQFCNPGLLVRHLDQQNRHVEISILIDLKIYKYNFELYGHIKWPPKGLKIFTESGKVEIYLEKHESQTELWKNLGKYNQTSLTDSDSLEKEILEFKLLSKEQLNKDSFAISLKNDNCFYMLPVGYHLSIEAVFNGKKMSKNYTPVPQKYLNKYKNVEMDGKYKHFLIKQYPHLNSFSRHICYLEQNAAINISMPEGNLKLSILADYKRFCFFAAGSGLTPFLALIDHLLGRSTNRIEVLKLFYFNKTFSDIWCYEMLSRISLEDTRFQFVNVLSDADDSWRGQKGRVSSELLFPIVNKFSIEKINYIAVCGPAGFNKNVEDILRDFNFPNENLFIF